ncbi:hypothetical protein PF008_g27457 [Phytophthora fragariae]|uniref:Uncharacterized protein n=1 Tax=Phytophthora fragariae TaxID=53985 RepID=A0A6G0QEA4_9STRA|nr:hypothetical protein PF008_g27457 [Phytophthora fragariae]
MRQRLRPGAARLPAVVVGPETPALQHAVRVELVQASGHREAVVGFPHASRSCEEAATCAPMRARRLPLVTHGRPLGPVSVLDVQLHVPQDRAVIQPLVVVRHAELQRGRLGAGVRARRRGRELEAERAEVALDVDPKRTDVTITALRWRVGRRPELRVEQQLAQLLVAPLPRAAVDPVARVGDLPELRARDAPDGRVLRVQHLPSVRDLERCVQLRQWQQAQSAARHRRVEALRRGVVRQLQEVAEAAREMAVEALELLLEGAEVAESVLYPGVEIRLHRLHHLPRGEARLQQRRRVVLELLECWGELDAAAHVIEAIADPQVGIRSAHRQRGDRRAIQVQLEVFGLEHAASVALDRHGAALVGVRRHAGPAQEVGHERVLSLDAVLGAAENLEVVGIGRGTGAVISRQLHARSRQPLQCEEQRADGGVEELGAQWAPLEDAHPQRDRVRRAVGGVPDNERCTLVEPLAHADVVVRHAESHQRVPQ